MSQANKYFAGLDIGGSTVKAALVDANGASTGALVEVKSRVKEGYKTTFEQLQEALRQLAEKANIEVSAIRGAGMDVPAPNCEGVVWTRANLGDDWVGTNVRDELSELLGIPVYMTNDGNAAALGEYAVRPDYSGGLLLVAPGTGLGGGLVLPGGKIYAGANGLALEVGHISVPHREENGELPECSCGLKGCAEAWVSLMALRRRVSIEVAKDEWKDHPLASDEISVIEKAFQLRDYAEKDDPLAVQIFQQQGQILGYALADLVRVLTQAKLSLVEDLLIPAKISVTATWAGYRKASLSGHGLFTEIVPSNLKRLLPVSNGPPVETSQLHWVWVLSPRTYLVSSYP